jgi:hypothetical protein
MLNRFPGLRDPDGFAALDPICEQTERFTALDRSFAYHQLTRILVHNGGRLADITVADCIEAYRAQVGYAARQHGQRYLLLRQAGFLPAESAPTIWAASRRGQLSVEELVDGYEVACRPVRNLFVDYLHSMMGIQDIKLGWEPFDRADLVQSDHRQFARQLLDRAGGRHKMDFRHVA